MKIINELTSKLAINYLAMNSNTTTVSVRISKKKGKICLNKMEMVGYINFQFVAH